MNQRAQHRIWVTGSTGRIGARLVPLLGEAGFDVHGFSGPRGARASGFEPLPETVGELAERIAGSAALVHLAAPNPSRLRAAIIGRSELERDHVRLARLAGEAVLLAGVPRLIHLSSARVYGIQPSPYREDATPARPVDPYGDAKLAAERVLSEVFAREPDRLVMLRVPVVHGTGRLGAAGLAAEMARRGLPLPQRIAGARKSVLGIENLAGAIAHFSDATRPGGIFNMADPDILRFGDYAGLFMDGSGRQIREAHWPDQLADIAKFLPVAGPAVRHLAADCVLDCTKAQMAAGCTAGHTTAHMVHVRKAG